MQKPGLNNNIPDEYYLPTGEKHDILDQLFENFPYPVEVFAADGTLLMINQAGVMASGIEEISNLLGKYNILADPIIAELDYLDEIKRAFAGERVYLGNVKAPVKNLRVIFNACFRGLESVYHDIIAFPVTNAGNKAAYVAVIMLTRSAYTGKDTIVKAMEYMDSHWDQRFYIEEVAKAAHLSAHYFSRLFKNELGITPYQYYLNLKMEMIREKLADGNASIKETFAACGISYNGYYANVFKQKVGVKPSEYRAMVLNK